MLLVIDAGNTNIVAALMKNREAVYVKRYETGKRKNDEYHYNVLNSFLKSVDEMIEEKILDCIEGAIISSVVPEINDYLKAAVINCIHKEPLFVSHLLNTGLKIKYDTPSKLGADLIAGAAGAVNKYSCPVIMIDIGTATTFSVVNKKSEYIGGMIAPGPYSSLRALTSSASLLPKCELPIIDKVIGTNTKDCMSVGAFTAHAAMIDGMIDRMSEVLNEENIKIVATGGPAREIARLCRHDIICDRDLVLSGIYEIFYMN